MALDLAYEGAQSSGDGLGKRLSREPIAMIAALTISVEAKDIYIILGHGL